MNQIRSRHSPDHRPKQKLDHPPSNPQTRTPKLPTTTRGTRSALAHRRPGRGIAPPAHPPPVHMYTEASVRGHEHTCGGDSPAPRLPGAACARGDGRVGLTVDADVVDCRHLCRHCLEQAGSMGVWNLPPPSLPHPQPQKGHCACAADRRIIGPSTSQGVECRQSGRGSLSPRLGSIFPECGSEGGPVDGCWGWGVVRCGEGTTEEVTHRPSKKSIRAVLAGR